MTRETIRTLNERDRAKGYSYSLAFVPMNSYRELTGYDPEQNEQDYDAARGKMRVIRRTFKENGRDLPQYLTSRDI